MTTALLLASTPLHSFWSLGLACGPFAERRCVLAMIDQRPGDTDYVYAALSQKGGVFSEVLSFPRVGKSPWAKLAGARAVMRQVAALSARLRPDYITVGNDRRAEFYAALAASPGATGAYVDDGMFSYMPMRADRGSADGDAFAAMMRRLVYGVAAEHPRFVGGSRAVADAWVMLPEKVHEGLQSKKLHAIERQWFQDSRVREVCAAAVALSGLPAATVRGIGLLLVLPHDSFLREHTELARRLSALAYDHALRGERVAFKRHPRSVETSVDLLPAGSIEIPRRLPIELLAPLLSGTLVVGTLTTALISLKHLADDVRVRSLVGISAQSGPAAEVYRAAGIETLE